MGLLGHRLSRLADVEVAPSLPDAGPGPVGAVSRGWQHEFLALGSYQQAPSATDGTVTAVGVTGTVFQTTNTIHVPGRIRTVLIGIPTSITFAAAQQITATLISGRQQRTAVAGAAEQMPDAATETDKVGAAFNVGTSSAATGQRWFWITPQEIPQLQWPLGWVGLEINMPVGPTAGALYVAFYVGPI